MKEQRDLKDLTIHDVQPMRWARAIRRIASSSAVPLSSEYGTYKTVKARFWPWLSEKSPEILSRCSSLGCFREGREVSVEGKHGSRNTALTNHKTITKQNVSGSLGGGTAKGGMQKATLVLRRKRSESLGNRLHPSARI